MNVAAESLTSVEKARVRTKDDPSKKKRRHHRSDVAAIIKSLLLTQSIKRIPMKGPASSRKKEKSHRSSRRDIEKKLRQGQRKGPNRGVLVDET